MAQVGRGVSLHLHVSILLSTRFFFYANLSFSYAVPLFFLCSTARVGRGRGTLLQDPTFFGAILYAELAFVYAAFVLFLCAMGHFPSISMSLPPSPCLHPVVDMFVFLCPRVFLLCVRFLLLCHRCFFANLSFSCAVPSSSYAPRRGWDGGGAPFYKTRPFLVLSFMRSWLLFMLRLSFSYAPWGAFHPSPCLCLHLHVSHPVVDIFFSDCEPYLFLCCSCPSSCAPWVKGWGRGGHGAHYLGQALLHGLYANQILFYADSLLCILHLSASRPCCAMAPPAAPPTSSSTSQHQHQHQHLHQHQHQQHQQQQ